MLTDVRALIFDVGSVLVDERHTYRRFRRAALERLPHIDARTLNATLRTSLEQRQPRLSHWALRQLGGHETLSAEIWDSIGNLDRPYPEAEPALATLKERYRLAILGNQGHDARERLERAGLLAHCAAVVISAEVGLEKPDPRIFHMTLDALGIDPGQAAMVGDRLDLDIGPARRLGLRGIRMRRGPHVWQLPVEDVERPDATVRSLSELARRLGAG